MAGPPPALRSRSGPRRRRAPAFAPVTQETWDQLHVPCHWLAVEVAIGSGLRSDRPDETRGQQLSWSGQLGSPHPRERARCVLGSRFGHRATLSSATLSSAMLSSAMLSWWRW